MINGLMRADYVGILKFEVSGRYRAAANSLLPLESMRRQQRAVSPGTVVLAESVTQPDQSAFQDPSVPPRLQQRQDRCPRESADLLAAHQSVDP